MSPSTLGCGAKLPICSSAGPGEWVHIVFKKYLKVVTQLAQEATSQDLWDLPGLWGNLRRRAIKGPGRGQVTWGLGCSRLGEACLLLW